MKKLLLLSVAASALMIGHSAQAADLPSPVMKAPPPAPVWSWTGCFVGAQVGWGWQRNKIGQTQFNTIAGATFRSASSGNLDSSGSLFGGQVGCDYQFAGSNFVLGVQGTYLGTDISRTGQDPHNGARQTTSNPAIPSNFIFSGGSIAVDTKSLASATARLGWTGWGAQTLLYVKGGGAWVETQLDMRSSAIGVGGIFPAAAIFTKSYTGWTVGGGAEWMIAGNWSAFVEGNYYDFKSKNILNQRFGPPNIRGQTLDNGLNIITASVGVNYHFNWGRSVAARY